MIKNILFITLFCNALSLYAMERKHPRTEIQHPDVPAHTARVARFNEIDSEFTISAALPVESVIADLKSDILEIIKLLRNPENLTITDDKGNSIAQLLLQRIGQLAPESDEALILMRALRSLMQSPQLLRTTNKKGQSLIFSVVEYCTSQRQLRKFLRILHQHKVDFAQRDLQGNTLLHHFLKNNPCVYEDILQSRDHVSHTPEERILFLSDTVHLLLECGVSLGVSNHMGESVKDYASEITNDAVRDALIAVLENIKTL